MKYTLMFWMHIVIYLSESEIWDIFHCISASSVLTHYFVTVLITILQWDNLQRKLGLYEE